MRGILKTPLLWFLVLGAALFLLDGLQRQRAGQTIHITRGDIQRIRDQWQAQSGKPVTQDMLNALIQEQIQQRRLYREALALGLDQDDVIVRRRLAQKLRFLTEDLNAETEPDEAAVKTYFEQQRALYTLPSRLSFHHIYFSREVRGNHASEDAIRALAQLQSGQIAQTNWQKLGDPFMLGRIFQQRSTASLSQQFGQPFVEALLNHVDQGWIGPVESALGIHLVQVDDFQPARLPALDEVRARVLEDYRVSQRALSYQHYLATLGKKYPVVIQAEAPLKIEPQSSRGAAVARANP